MASLLGKADATIAGMSYREAMADVTPDLKGVYQDKVLNQAMFQKGVEDHFDTLYADNNLLADELKEATTLAMADLGTDYEGMELFNTALTSMKTRMKALPKGKKGDFERAKIRGELAELKRSTDGMGDSLASLGVMLEAGDFDGQAMGKLSLSQLKEIVSNKAKRKIVNGKLFYSFENPDGGKDIEVDQQVLKDMLIQTDPEHQGNFNKIHEGSNAQGKIEGNEFNRELYANKYEESFTSKKVFATNVNKKQHDLEYSLKEALQGKDTAGTLKLDSIYETLMSIGNKDNFFNGSDTDKDGDVDAQDFASAENGIALIESLTDINSKNFNFQVAKKVAAEFYADNISAKEFEVGVNLRAIVPQWKKEGYANKGAFLKAQDGSDIGGKVNQLNPFGSSEADYVDDGSTKGKHQPFGTRNNKRRTIMNIVQNKPGAGEKFVGVLGDYIWNGETWDLGEKSISTTEMMKDEKAYFAGGDFENNLTRKQVETKPLELSSLGNAKNVGEVFSAIKSTYNNKNNAIKKSTGSIGGLSARKSGQSIYIMVDGVEKEFSLGSAGGFGGTSVNEGKRISYLTNLEALLNAVNSSLNPEYINTDYNSTNNTETN